MPNHGKCVNCYWFLNNICYMQSSNVGNDCFEPHYVDDYSYCPDYYNRKRTKDRLIDWINEQKN